MKKRFTETQIIGFSEASYYLWRSTFGGMSVSDAKRLKELETENGRLKKLLSESQLKIEVTREVLQKKMVTAPVRREVVREMVARGPSERRALAVGRMSASAFRYVPRPDGNAVVRDRIVDLAQRHRRYGAGMIYLKLRQAGHVINHKRVDRLYTEARLQLKRRRRKQIPRADRQPLVRPERRNQVWSADFVFDRTADGRVMKCLTIVEDATHEAVAIVPARAFGGLPVTRALDRLAITRGLPQILRTACYEQVDSALLTTGC